MDGQHQQNILNTNCILSMSNCITTCDLKKVHLKTLSSVHCIRGAHNKVIFNTQPIMMVLYQVMGILHKPPLNEVNVLPVLCFTQTAMSHGLVTCQKISLIHFGSSKQTSKKEKEKKELFLDSWGGLG